jgi:hypothetical protein
LTVKVLIGATDDGGGFTDEVGMRWKMAINRVWSDKATVSINETVGAQVTTHTRSVLFDIAWNDADAEYSVESKHTPGMKGHIASIDSKATDADRRARLVSLGGPSIVAATYDIAWAEWKNCAVARHRP